MVPSVKALAYYCWSQDCVTRNECIAIAPRNCEIWSFMARAMASQCISQLKSRNSVIESRSARRHSSLRFPSQTNFCWALGNLFDICSTSRFWLACVCVDISPDSRGTIPGYAYAENKSGTATPCRERRSNGFIRSHWRHMCRSSSSLEFRYLFRSSPWCPGRCHPHKWISWP